MSNLQDQLAEYRKLREQRYKQVEDDSEDSKREEEEAKEPLRAPPNKSVVEEESATPRDNKKGGGTIPEGYAPVVDDRDPDLALAMRLQEEEYRSASMAGGIPDDYAPNTYGEFGYQGETGMGHIDWEEEYAQYRSPGVDDAQPGSGMTPTNIPPITAPSYRVYDFREGDNKELLEREGIDKELLAYHENKDNLTEQMVKEIEKQVAANQRYIPTTTTARGVRAADQYQTERLIDDYSDNPYEPYYLGNAQDARRPLLEGGQEGNEPQVAANNDPNQARTINFWCFRNVNPRILLLAGVVIIIMTLILILFLIDT